MAAASPLAMTTKIKAISFLRVLVSAAAAACAATFGAGCASTNVVTASTDAGTDGDDARTGAEPVGLDADAGTGDAGPSGPCASKVVYCDDASGLMWERKHDDDAFADSESYCSQTTYEGFSDWRLPTISELRSLIRGCAGTALDGPCRVTDQCRDPVSCDPLTGTNGGLCRGCAYRKGPNHGCYLPDAIACPSVGLDVFVSSTSDPRAPQGWMVRASTGSVTNVNQANNVLCVRTLGK